jgi:hypothetical protein
MESNVQSLIAEIKSDFSKYSDAGLIDENAIYRDIVLALKKFGNDLTELQETVVDVKDSYGVLPDSFFSLYAAYLCEPAYYKTSDIEYHDLQQSYFYRERVESSSKWNECESCCEVKEEKIIKENLYFKRGKAEFYYQNPTLLSLGKTFKKSACHDKCRNKLVKDNPNEIVIYGTTLQTNFKEGSVYMQYYGLPMNENGSIDIPETKNGFLETYLEYHLKRRLAERLMGNNDAQGLSQLYNVYAQQEQISLKSAAGNIKMSKINPRQLTERIQRLNKSETLAYEVRV